MYTTHSINIVVKFLTHSRWHRPQEIVFADNNPRLSMQVFVEDAPPLYVCTAPGWVDPTNAI
jgi:hypothetical protein